MEPHGTEPHRQFKEREKVLHDQVASSFTETVSSPKPVSEENVNKINLPEKKCMRR